MNPPTHLDLCSGIGGFALAARWTGWQTVAFCEVDPYAAAVLHRHWPDLPVYPDIRKLCRRAYDCEARLEEPWCPRCHNWFAECECVGTDQFVDTHGIPNLITAGFPCQDISNAGDRLGLGGPKSSLWHECYRVINELGPDFVLLENVSALLVRGYDRVAADLEKAGYTVWSFVLGAWTVGAPHKRERIWVVAIQNTKCQRLEGDERKKLENALQRGYDSDASRPAWRHTSPRVCRRTDGIPNRVDRLRCLGNAIVPQIAALFLGWMRRLV